MNAPSRFELFVLEDGEKSVEVSEDTKIPNAATFKVVKQDHTLANMIRAELLSMPEVLFAGYKIPHPLRPHFLLKVQTDGSSTPTETLTKACERLIGTLASLEAKFKREFSYKEQEGAAGGGESGMDAYGGAGAGAGGMGADGAGGGWNTGRDYLDF